MQRPEGHDVFRPLFHPISVPQQRHAEPSQTLRKVLTNPLIIATVAGLSRQGIGPHGPADRHDLPRASGQRLAGDGTPLHRRGPQAP